MEILILNGPNLNLLGRREPGIYGNRSFEDFFPELEEGFPQLKLTQFQSNHEGMLLDKLHEVGFTHHGVVLNAGRVAFVGPAGLLRVSITTCAVAWHIGW